MFRDETHNRKLRFIVGSFRPDIGVYGQYEDC